MCLSQELLFIGNHERICEFSSHVVRADKLPVSLDSVQVIFIFSGIETTLNDEDQKRLLLFLNTGGGVYLGAENWPFQAESNTLTELLYQERHYGYFDQRTADSVSNHGNLAIEARETVEVGTTCAAFPMHPDLTVELWVYDQPLLLSGHFGEGRIVIDGGYSRFYCDRSNPKTRELMEAILQFLNPGPLDFTE